MDQGVAVRKGRGKSGLRRVLGLVAPGRGDPTESATEKRPPMAAQADQARVKRWGKSPPPDWQQDGQGKPPREQDQISRRTAQAARVDPTEPAGRSLEVAGNIHPRGMTSRDRTRLTDPPRPPQGGRAYVLRGEAPSPRRRSGSSLLGRLRQAEGAAPIHGPPRRRPAKPRLWLTITVPQGEGAFLHSCPRLGWDLISE